MGYSPAPKIVDATRLQGRDISKSGPTDAEALKWDAATSKWIPAIDEAGSSGTAWGDITGTLSDQTDLASALSGKQSTLTLGTGVTTALGVNVGSAGAFVTNGGALGTPSSGTGTNITGIPESGVTNLTSDLALKAPLASPTFTGTVTLPASTSLTTPVIGAATGTSLTASGSTLTLTGGNGGLTIAAGGTNQNVTLTPSGTGVVQAATISNAESRLVASGNVRVYSTGSGKFIVRDSSDANNVFAVQSSTGVIGIGPSSDLGLSRSAAGVLAVAANNTAGDFSGSVKATNFYSAGTSYYLRKSAAVTGGATGNVPTLTGGPVTGDPTKWLPIDDNGTTRYIPAW